MSDAPEEIEVVLPEPEAAAAPEVEPKVEVQKAAEEPAKDAPKAIEPEEGIQALKNKLEAERRAREESERRAAQADARARQAAEETQGSNLALVSNAIELVKQQQEHLKAKYKEARATGDVDTEAEIADEMAANRAKMLQLEQGKQALEQAPKREAKPEPVVDRVEHLAKQMTSRSAEWVRAHPEFARDDRKYAAMIGAHNAAVNGRGLTPDTDAYFEFVEQTLGLKQPDVSRASEPTAETPRRQAAPAAAPVSRSGDPVNPRPNTVTLTREQVEMARMMDMSPEAYARQLQNIQREQGKLH